MHMFEAPHANGAWARRVVGEERLITHRQPSAAKHSLLRIAFMNVDIVVDIMADIIQAEMNADILPSLPRRHAASFDKAVGLSHGTRATGCSPCPPLRCRALLCRYSTSGAHA